MSIEVRAHAKDPAVLAELIADTMQDGVVIGREPTVAHLSALVAQEEREVARRRDAWRWLNTIALPKIDHENDWSNV